MSVRRLPFLAALILAGAAFAVPAAPKRADPFAAAGAAYEKGKYADALRLYEAALDSGPLTFAVAYNIGNTQFRLGRRGPAVLWFERARSLSPRDEDARVNLRLARSHLADEGGSAWEALDRVATPRELPWAVAALAWLFFVPAGLALFGAVPWGSARRVAVPAGILLCVFGAWLGLRVRASAEPWAVVTVPVAEARSGPGEANPVGFTVPEGRRCLLTGVRPGWVEIGVPAQGLKGWVTEGSVERIALPAAAGKPAGQR